MQTAIPHASSRRAQVAGVLLGLLALAIPAAAQSILVNGDFETATPDGWNNNAWAKFYQLSEYPLALAGWSYAAGGGAADAIISFHNPGSPFDGIGNLVGLGAGSNAVGGSLSQGFGAIEGATYTASLDVAYIGNGGGSAITFGVYDAANGDSLVGLQTISFGTLTNTFQNVSFDFVAPSTSLVFKIADSSGATSDTDVAADNASVSLKTIPESSTYAAIAGVLTLGFAFWRRQRR